MRNDPLPSTVLLTVHKPNPSLPQRPIRSLFLHCRVTLAAVKPRRNTQTVAELDAFCLEPQSNLVSNYSNILKADNIKVNNRIYPYPLAQSFLYCLARSEIK